MILGFVFYPQQEKKALSLFMPLTEYMAFPSKF